MRRLIAIAIVAGFGLGVLLVLADRANSVTGIGRFRETQISHRIIGTGAGAIEVWRTRVYTYSGTVVGTGAFACTFIDRHTSVRQCTGTYLLPLGKLIIAGEMFNRGGVELAVVAGTRFYSGSHGSAVFHLYAKQPPQSFLTFYLIGGKPQ